MALTSPLVEEPMTETRFGLVHVNHVELMHKLMLRGKAPSNLREARVSYETLAKIRRGEPIAARTFQRILVQLGKWPELDHAADLIVKEMMIEELPERQG